MAHPSLRAGNFICLKIVLVSFLVVLMGFNISSTLSTVVKSRWGANYQKSYSYVGLDYPEIWPIETREIAMTVEETVHYPISGSDAQEEWASSASDGFGYARVGPEGRAFAIDVFHQLHCLRLMRSALMGDHRPNTDYHMQHCLNFIRQMVLCSPNLTLEPADVLTRTLEVERVGATHFCTDWRVVYDEMAGNWDSWLQKQNGNGTTNSP